MFAGVLQVYAKVSGEPSLETPTIDISSEEFYGVGYDDSDKRIPDMTIINRQLGMMLCLISFHISLRLRLLATSIELHNLPQVGTRRRPSGTCWNQLWPINIEHTRRPSSRQQQNQLHPARECDALLDWVIFFLPSSFLLGLFTGVLFVICGCVQAFSPILFWDYN